MRLNRRRVGFRRDLGVESGTEMSNDCYALFVFLLSWGGLVES